MIWKSENPNTFSKIVAIQSGGGIDQFEHIVTQNGSVNPPIPQSITPAPAASCRLRRCCAPATTGRR